MTGLNNMIIIDLGNTLFKVAVFDNDSMVSLEIFKSGSFSELTTYLKTFPSGNYCILSSVIAVPLALKKLLQDYFTLFLLDAGTPLPIKNLYKTPDTLGKDRVAAAVAAWNTHPDNDILVIDAGTAITIDLVNKHGEFTGGAISPGLDMRFKALHNFTGQLPLVKKQNIGYLAGQTTEESIRSGVINGIVAEIDGIIDKYKELYPGLIIIFGGGDSNFLLKRLKNSIFALPNPVLNGLHLILKHNIENKDIA
jgi:type III pantothenate kinase